MRSKIHPAWIVAAITFGTLFASAGFRSAPSVLILPLEEEFGWRRDVISAAIAINVLLFGLTAPFAAALMDRFTIRKVVMSALSVISLGALLTIWMNQSWHLLLLWGVVVGIGTGSMALVFAATIANRWFVKKRGLVIGVLTAAGASGQLVLNQVFLLATGNNEPQLQALADEVMKKLAEVGEKPIRKEGSGSWILLDYTDLVVHIQSVELRNYYMLDRLWNDCPKIELDLAKAQR